MNRRFFLRAAAGTALIGAVGIGYCLTEKDTNEIEVVHVPLDLGLGKPLRITLLGDIHFDPLYEVAYIAKVIELVNKSWPDLILYTGDFVTANGNRIDVLASLLSHMIAPFGTYSVPGNHEHWNYLPRIADLLEKHANIRMLINESIPLPGRDGFYLTGLDSYWAGVPDPSVLNKTPRDSRHIVLVHEPDSFLTLTDPRIKLQISGHTHGGQVRLPLLGAMVLPKLGHHFQTGLYQRDNRMLYVNRGIGTLAPHVRVNCRPEITVFELT